MSSIANLYTVNTTISSSLTSNSSIFNRNSDLNRYYFEGFQIRVRSNGSYRFLSISSVDTYGYFYLGSFNPALPYQNLLISDDDSGGNAQFQFRYFLETNQTYILVFTTYSPLVATNFSLVVSGLISVNITKVNYNSSFVNGTTFSSSTSTSPTTNPTLTSGYSSALTINSRTYTRYGSSGIFYYEAILITTSVSGNYTIQSNSTIDAYGYLYLNSFNANDMITNILAIDDDSGENGQFLISYTLQANGRYIVIMTTYFQNITAPFSIIVTGPAIVSMSYLETISTTSTTTTSGSSTRSTSQSSTTRDGGFWTFPPIICKSRKINRFLMNFERILLASSSKQFKFDIIISIFIGLFVNFILTK